MVYTLLYLLLVFIEQSGFVVRAIKCFLSDRINVGYEGYADRCECADNGVAE